ncbi:MAG: hypothetical protein P4L43_04945, partial [Syntrophobacteraceae bacterium]|nr:hypothetical protein [Syntrophobacteraceae bacterium]
MKGNLDGKVNWRCCKLSKREQQFPVSNEKIAHALSKAVFAGVGFPGSGTSQKFDALRSPIHREKLA